MNNKSITDWHAASNRSKGLYIAIAGSLVLLILAAYKVPLFNNEVNGNIIGISEFRNEAGSKLIAAVQLDSGAQVMASMPGDLPIRQDISARINEGSTLLGRKTYSITAYNE
jgi:hypothetical protein